MRLEKMHEPDSLISALSKFDNSDEVVDLFKTFEKLKEPNLFQPVKEKFTNLESIPINKKYKRPRRRMITRRGFFAARQYVKIPGLDSVTLRNEAGVFCYALATEKLHNTTTIIEIVKKIASCSPGIFSHRIFSHAVQIIKNRKAFPYKLHVLDDLFKEMQVKINSKNYKEVIQKNTELSVKNLYEISEMNKLNLNDE
jgi:hypothetical protein